MGVKLDKISLLTIIKVVIMVGAYGYLAYMLITFDHYGELRDRFCGMSGTQATLFIAVLLLMPVNWGLEALKWRTLVRQLQPFTLAQAYRSVLMGLASGFFTPNRILDPVGRVLMLEDENKAKGVLYSLVQTLAQSFASCVFLAVALMLLPSANILPADVPLSTLNWVAGVFITVITLLYFTMPLWAPKVRYKRSEKIDNVLRAMAEITYPVLIKVSLTSIVRYAVYSLQYFLMLRFMAVDITSFQALILIPINYFLISVTPSVSFSELGIRGAFAMLLLGAVTTNTVGAAMAAVTVWAVNYIIPVITGSTLVAAE
ncbi:MAG: flippase-like domain-containing protein [Paludibacteraceae bacterium]|nr:flippase-like domain-containing protein [Paludibacteraceae bacterium]MBQ5524238.1 flippase-like domain-containing protein [Paludibacteraceae bacterium]